jgi:putative ABC transport system permease protein
LTILGVIIGVFVIILLFSLGGGVKAFIKNRLSEFGSDMIEITPGKSEDFIAMAWSSQQGRLDFHDVESIERIAGVEYVMPIVMEKIPAVFQGKTLLATVYGLGDVSIMSRIFRTRLESGRYLKDKSERAVVIGNGIAHGFFEKKEVRVGNIIKIGGKPFRVVGILERRGGMGGSFIDNAFFISLQNLKDLREIDRERVDFIEVKAKEGVKLEEVADEIKRIMRMRRGEHEGEESFRVWTAADFEEKASEILDVITAFLMVLGGVALVVGGIGIMNTMFMSVTEKTKMIGILKAIGATDEDVLTIFLIESGIISGVGGFIGVVLSEVVVFVAALYLNINAPFNPLIILGALLFSVLIGVISGLMPAWKATQISPAEAVRYE